MWMAVSKLSSVCFGRTVVDRCDGHQHQAGRRFRRRPNLAGARKAAGGGGRVGCAAVPRHSDANTTWWSVLGDSSDTGPYEVRGMYRCTVPPGRPAARSSRGSRRTWAPPIPRERFTQAAGFLGESRTRSCSSSRAARASILPGPGGWGLGVKREA